MQDSYPPLAEVRERLCIDWYRSPVERTRLRELVERSDARGWLQAGGHLGLFVFTGVATYAAWLTQAWTLFFVALWLHGTVASFFSGTAPHELAHGTVFRTRWLNRVFLYAFSLVSWWDPFDYAGSHTHHHRYTQHREADRENLLPLVPSLHPLLLLQLFTIKVFVKPGRNFGKGGLLWAVWLTVQSALRRDGLQDIPSREWLAAVHADQPAEHRRSVNWSRVLLAVHGSVLLVAIVTGQWVLPLLLSCASFIASAPSYFVGMTQHCGLREDCADFRKNTRSVRVNPLLGFLYWHMNWHTEHHMYAAVPCYNLRKLAREIEHDMPEPRTLTGAWKEMRSTWRRQQVEPNYAFDTPLPSATGHALGRVPALAASAVSAAACRGKDGEPSSMAPSQCGSATDDVLVSSVGDLAPGSLR